VASIPVSQIKAVSSFGVGTAFILATTQSRLIPRKLSLPPCVWFRELLNTRSTLRFNMSASSDWLGVILLSSIRFQQPER
jgi:hypothetical protein